MKEKKDIIKITEGATDFFVFNKKLSNKGPKAKDKLPFYNPAMELNRDLSILICQWLVDNSKRKPHFFDGLAATGARGIRIKNEVCGDFDITINDWNSEAYELIRKNVKHNRLKNVEVCNSNINTLLSENRYDYIDIDPFGTPAYYLDSAFRSINKNGVIAVTATDTATLCGVYPKVCKRRYNAMPLHSYFMKEVGLRILLGYICREALKYDKGIKPILCYVTDHYFRLYFMVRNGVDYANDSMKNYLSVNSEKFIFSKDEKKDFGPLWLAKTQNKQIISELRTILFEKQLNTKKSLWKLLDLLEDEADIPDFYYTSDEIASNLKRAPPKLEKIFDGIKKEGYKISRTHYTNVGFKTDAPMKKIEKVFKNC